MSKSAGNLLRSVISAPKKHIPSTSFCGSERVARSAHTPGVGEQTPPPSPAPDGRAGCGASPPRERAAGSRMGAPQAFSPTNPADRGPGQPLL